MMKYLFVNAGLVEDRDAVIAANDRGFRYGDGVFETIAIYYGLPYLWEYHLKRLAGGLAALHIKFNTQDLLALAITLLKANKTEEGLLRIQISRGVGSRGYLPATNLPTLVMETLERPSLKAGQLKLWLSTYEKISPRALPTMYKLAQGMNSTLARMQAAEHECDEALQLATDGAIAEASSANIFWRSNNVLYTPSLDCGILAGVTRARLIELSPYPVHEGSFALEALKHADAVVLCNSAAGATAAGTLLPNSYNWESATLAEEINKLRNKDIKQNTQRLRESLAQT